MHVVGDGKRDVKEVTRVDNGTVTEEEVCAVVATVTEGLLMIVGGTGLFLDGEVEGCSDIGTVGGAFVSELLGEVDGGGLSRVVGGTTGVVKGMDVVVSELVLKEEETGVVDG